MRVGVIGTRPNLVYHGRHFLSGSRSFAAKSVPDAVAGDRYQPPSGAIRQSITRPGAKRICAGLLDGVFGNGEVAGPPGDRGDGRTPFATEDAVQVDHRRYSPDTPAC